MQYTLTPGNQSNYVITLSVEKEALWDYKKRALTHFQKEMEVPWFRKGHVPLNMVEEKTNPAYIEMGILEEIVHTGTKKVIEENKNIKFIGNIYNLDRKEEDKNVNVSLHLDIYPEPKEENQTWKDIQPDTLDSTATDEEIQETIDNLRKQYADYQKADVIGSDTIFKVKMSFVNEQKEEVDTGSVFLWKEEFDEFPVIQEYFSWKKDGDEVTVPYNEEALPPMFHNRSKKEKEASHIICTISDTRKVILPEFTPENIKKFFGSDEVTTEEELKVKIAELIAKQKKKTQLMKTIDNFLTKAGESFNLIIPKTLIDEEVKTRMKSLEERMGWEDGFKKYTEQLGEEETTKMKEQIRAAAEQSLEKFFLLKTIVESLDIKDPDWNTPMDVEQKLYEKLTNK